MQQYSIIGIVLALVGLLKGKDIWEFLKHLTDSKNKSNDKVVLIYETQIKELKERIKELEAKQEILIEKLEAKITRSRGKRT
jgi:hypothetical protein